MSRSTKIYGLDTSVFVRLLTGHPETDFKETVAGLKKLYDNDPATELVVSNRVIGEAYITLQHHYKISKADARAPFRISLYLNFLFSLASCLGIEFQNSDTLIA